jgi:hypothetical protein
MALLPPPSPEPERPQLPKAPRWECRWCDARLLCWGDPGESRPMTALDRARMRCPGWLAVQQ